MIYKHEQFILGSEKKKIFDENKKKLHITGNAYRVLVFLCEKKNATITEIGDALDWAKDYTENHIRQYRYKINTIIGNKVIEYKNGVYSLVGDVEKFDRNTDLLHWDNIKLEKNVMEKLKEIKITIIPGILAVTLLLLSFLDWPYGYYTLLRFIVTAVAIYYLYCLYIKEKIQTVWFWGLMVIGILFNPFIPVILGDKAIWGIIDVITAIFFISLIIKYKNK